MIMSVAKPECTQPKSSTHFSKKDLKKKRAQYFSLHLYSRKLFIVDCKWVQNCIPTLYREERKSREQSERHFFFKLHTWQSVKELTVAIVLTLSVCLWSSSLGKLNRVWWLKITPSFVQDVTGKCAKLLSFNANLKRAYFSHLRTVPT